MLTLLGYKASGKVITDEDIEELNRLIPDGQWTAGRVFESTEEPLLGALPNTLLEEKGKSRLKSSERW